LYPDLSKTTFLRPFSRARSAIFFPTASALSTLFDFVSKSFSVVDAEANTLSPRL
jgi:hypothetical protein